MRSDRIVEDGPAGVKSNCFSKAGVKRSRVRHRAIISTTGKPMRSRALLFTSVLPIALLIAPSAAHGQRTVYRYCSDGNSRYYDCTYDRDIAERAREAGARAREAAARARAEARESANWARSYARSYEAAARADAQNWERSLTRIRIQNEARIRANNARIRANELRDRQRDRARELERQRRDRERDRYYRRW